MSEVYESYYNERKTKCDFFQNESNGKLLIDIEESSNRDVFRDSLMNIKSGSYLREHDIVIMVLLTSILGCVSIQKGRHLFIEERNRDIGRVIYNVPLPEPNEILKIDERKSKYLYTIKSTGCQWINIIDNKTKKKFLGIH